MTDDWEKLKLENQFNNFKIRKQKEYSNDLLDYNWNKKRLEILRRDNNNCVNCSKNINLHIHHLLYFNNKHSWEYDNQYLITLCDNCHEWEHKDYGIGNFKRYLYWQNIINKLIKIDNT